MQVVFGYIFGLVIFHDPLSILGLAGSGLICLGVLAVTWPARSATDRYSAISEPSLDIEALNNGSQAPEDGSAEQHVLEVSMVEEGPCRAGDQDAQRLQLPVQQ